MKTNVLITGGAGFIGSNLVKALLKDERIGKVRVLDNLSTGFYRNISAFEKKPDFEFIKGDIRDFDTCKKACEGMDLISHQAALGSVPRSISDPITSNAVNISGTLNIFYAAKECNIKKVVYAASSSTYGDSKNLPKVEHIIGQPLSPYAITKYVNELYAKIFSDLYNMNLIGLRYFNVFGPNQDPDGAYAAVIPLFFKSALQKKAAIINGDGLFSRDFTYVENAVNANILALLSDNPEANNQVYNIACGERTTLNELWQYICEALSVSIEPLHGPERSGDIPHSLANVEKGKKLLNYNPKIKVREGLQKAAHYYKEYFNS